MIPEVVIAVGYYDVEKPFKSLSLKYESLEIDYPRMSTGGHPGENASIAAIYPFLSVKPPKSVEFSMFEEWPRWVRQFELYRVILKVKWRLRESEIQPTR